MRRFFSFDKMITPNFIQLVFIIMLLCCLFVGLHDMIKHHAYGHGIVIIIAGPIITRIFCELVMVFFQINKHLRSIDQKLRTNEPPPEESSHE